MSTDLITETEGGIARISINRPESRNAISGEMLLKMLAFVREIAAMPEIRVLLISGVGPHFAAGGDVKSFADALSMSPEALGADFMRRSEDAMPLWTALSELPKPVVCAARGITAGAALSFIAGADYTIISENAQFVLAHVGIGLVADGATSYHLPRTIGIRRAKELAFFGDRINAEQALQFGLVNKIVPDSELEAETDKVLQRLLAAPAVSIAQAKKLMNESFNNTIEAQLALETLAVGACGASGDIREGIKAFTEKRRPKFG